MEEWGWEEWIGGGVGMERVDRCRSGDGKSE